MAELTVERLFSDPPLSGGLPQDPQFTPDGEHASYLRLAPDDRERLDLWRCHLATGRHERWLDASQLAGVQTREGQEATAAEKSERERRRQFARGITAYSFSPDGACLLLPLEGAAFLVDLASGEIRSPTPKGTRQTDMRFSPDGASLTYVRSGNLYRCDLAGDAETPLTTDGGGTISNGLAEFIAAEEMHRFDGYWWSPDSAYLAFTRVDESQVTESLRYEIQAEGVTVVPQRYPYAGASNARVRLRVLCLESGSVRDIPYARDPDDYLARVTWLGKRLAVQRQSRDQHTLEVYAFDPQTGDGECLLTETSSTWVNLHDNLLPLTPTDSAPDSGDVERFLWTSERSGFSHLYIHEAGTLRPLTAGEGRVTRVLWADAARALVAGWFETPTEQHLYEVALQGDAAPRRLTQQAGWHEPVISRDGKRALDRLTAVQIAGRLDLLDLSSEDAPRPRGQTLVEESISAVDHPYFPYAKAHVTPQLGTLAAEDGQRLHFRLARPAGAAPAGGFPVIVYVYGGPGVQRVRNEWAPLLLQLLCQHGYAVLELDNRGSGNRHPGFEAPIYRRLGAAEVRDQVAGAQSLANLPWVNPHRIGVFGHSYGGYMTLMCLLQAPEIFKAGVAVAPVTDWRLYDTHYTERYLATPAANPEGYEASSVFGDVSRLAGKLLLIHGMADDNVLFTHSTKLYRTLQAHNVPFEMMAYPGSKHALQERDVSIHRFNLLLDFFARHL